MRTMFNVGIFGILSLFWLGGNANAADQPSPSTQKTYKTQIQPLLQKYCYRCHTGDRAKAGVQLDKLATDFVNGPAGDLETWHDVLENMHRGEMPPKRQPQPTAKEHGTIVDWLNRAFVEAREKRESTGGKIVMRRLTRYEYQNTLEDLLGLKLNYAKDLLAEVPSRDGFLNNGKVLTTSSQHLRSFWNAARYAMSKAIVTGSAPKVHRYAATQFRSFTGRGRKKKNIPGGKGYENVLLPDTALMMPLNTLPREGRFRVRINLNATGPKTSLLAWLKISRNNQTSLIFAKPEISPSPQSQNVDIFANVEDIPILSERDTNQRGITPFLCISNVGNIHFFRGGNGSIYPKGLNPGLAEQHLTGDPDKRNAVPILRINSIEFEGPFFTSWPPVHHKRIFFESPNAGDETVYAREVIAAFMKRAFRRPVTDAEVATIAKLHEKIRPKFDTLEEAMRETLALVLVSPQFLHLVEPRKTQTAHARVTEFEWATRLSYFLWNSMPDAELINLAKNGKLKDADIRRQQIERMLADKRSWRFIETFTDQWLGLSNLEQVAVNPEFHANFDNDLKGDMRRETQLFFAEFLKSNTSMLRLIDADFTFLNNRLADHYGIPHGQDDDVSIGSAFQRVELKPEYKRDGGILTHGSMLVLNSDGVESHPIKRAVWIRNAIFDDPPPEPPANVPELNTEDRGKGNAQTLKQRIEQHRIGTSCYHCHSRIDPWGIPFEQYDALGRYRTRYASLDTKPKGKKKGNRKKNARKKKLQLQKLGATVASVDAKAELPDGRKVDGVSDLKQYILTHGKQRFARAIVRKTLAYALGRSLEVSDQPFVEQLTRQFIADDLRYRPLILAVVQSELFLTK